MLKPNLGYINQLVGNNAYLAKLIFDILNLGFRIEHHNTESWYFKVGLSSQKNSTGSIDY